MNRNELNRQRTIKDIQDAFMIMFEKRGLEKVSVVDICKEANISKTIFYRYFDDKYALLEEIENELLQSIAEINKDLVHAPLGEYRKGEPFPVFLETAQFIHSQKQYFKPLLGINGDPHFIFRWKKQIRQDVRKKFENDQITAYNLDVVTELFAAAIIGLYTYWFFERPEMTCEEISEIGGNLLCGSFYNFQD